MSVLKRKGAKGADASDKSNKRQKTNKDTTEQPSNVVEEKDKKTAPVKSVLSMEQPAFPRGGAGTLTLLEKKQIRAQASRDIARETESGDLFDGNQEVAENSDESDLDLEGVDDKQTFAVKKKSKKTNKVAVSESSDAVRIDSVSHKRLFDGCLLLGRISNISSRGLTVSLPNNLSGFVPLTTISTQYTSKLEKAAKDDSDDADQSEDEEVDDETTDLRKHFQIGQFLRVSVLKKDEDKLAKKDKRKNIILATDPKLVNRGLLRNVLTPGITIQASIASIEDHGAIVDIGFDDGTPAFISKNALPEGLELSDVRVGSVFLCSVTSVSAKGKAVQLSADFSSTSPAKKSSSVDAYLPGTQVEVLLTHVSQEGLAGKVLGVLDATADTLHAGVVENKDEFTSKYQIGQKVIGRVIANLSTPEDKRLSFSLLPNLVEPEKKIEARLALSSVVDRAQVLSVVPNLGIYLSLPGKAVGFAHIARLSDQNVDMISELSGGYKKGTEHQARVLDYNAIDGIYILSLQKSVLEQPFLRVEDIEIGQIVKGSVEKLVSSAEGITGLVIKIAPGITGYVSLMHMSDTTLKNPEKKFKEGMSVKTRVLSVNLDKRSVRLTLKKSLVNSDQPVWSKWSDLQEGQSTVGTLTKVEPKGALVHFYGPVKGRLPVSEMSEAFVKDATEHFKTGQVLTVHILRVDQERRRLTLSARDPSAATSNDTSTLSAGTLVTGTVFEKNADDIMIRLQPSGAIARLPLDHVADGSEKKRRSTLDKIRVGQQLEDLLILQIRGRQVTLSNKSSLRKAAEEGGFLRTFEDLKEDALITGYVKNITENRVFVAFAQDITGVINKASIPDEKAELPDFDMKRLQAVTARVVKIDYTGATPRFWLSMKTADAVAAPVKEKKPVSEVEVIEKEVVDPVDDKITSYSELVNGAILKVRVTSVKETQINVEIAQGIQGRIQVSEAFDNIEDIHDRKRPLKQFSSKQILEVRIIGQHDSRSYRFLPLSHRSSKNVVFELSARPSMIADTSKAVLKMEDLAVGDSYLAFVNNVAENSLMVNLSPAVRGRVRAADVSDDLNLAANLPRNFPVGSVLKTKIVAIDTEKNHLDLSAKTGIPSKVLSIENVSAGDIVAGRITKITDRAIIVQLSENLVGAVELLDIADDYDLADTTRFNRDEIIRAFVLRVDLPNKKIFLSLRPSKILSSGLDAKDPELTLEQLNINDIRRGFVSNVSEKGVFVALAHNLTAFIRVKNLSDAYIKDWQSQFQKDQLVQGKIIALDKDSGHVQMSLRKSHVDKTYRPPATFHDMKVGQIVKAKVAKVETFGLFIVVENSENVRGLCHRSEIAEKRIEDVTKAGFSEGDIVKAKVLKTEPNERRINFGMKASYFDDEDEGEEFEAEEGEGDEDQSSEDEDGSDKSGVELDTRSVKSDEDIDMDVSAGALVHDDQDTMDVDETTKPVGLSTGGFDWFGAPSSSGVLIKRAADTSDAEEANTSSKQKKKKRKPEIQIDRTGDLDKEGPQSVDDYERLLLSEPDNAQLWVQLMAFHLDLGDIDQAREVGKKALKSIGLAQEAEKMTIWSALLNLETTFGDDEAVESTVQRACETNDPEEVHSKLASIYIHSGKNDKADELFQTMTKRFTQNPKLWINYATFLFDTMEDAPRARALLPRALQALPPFTHFDITSKFAQLEFKTKTGVPEEGRTRFQGLANLYPKRLDLFNIMIDLEIKLGEKEQVRSLFDQVLSRKLKPSKAKPFFQKWQEFETGVGDAKKIEEVQEKAARWVAQYQKQAE